MQAMYVGSVDAALESHIFGAGCLPAVLNPTGDPEIEPVGCTLSFADFGMFRPREDR